MHSGKKCRNLRGTLGCIRTVRSSPSMYLPSSNTIRQKHARSFHELSEHRKRAPAEADAPFFIMCESDGGLRLFLCALVGRGIPHAASLLAIGFGLCSGYISREGWTGEGKGQRYGKCGNQGFHGIFSLTLD